MGVMMKGERRMLAAAVMLAVAQQDAGNVRWLGVSKSAVRVLSNAIAAEAREFVKSEGFDEMCEQIDVVADVLRAMDPKRALDLYQQITADGWEDSRLGKLI